MSESMTNENDCRSALFGAVEGANPSPGKLSDLFFRGIEVSEGVRLTSREQREVLLVSIANFHKGFARRFFAGMKAVLEKIVADETFVPESAFSEGDDDEIIMELDANSIESLNFLKASSLAVKAYLAAMVERRPETDSASKAYNVIDEVFACADALHSTLFSLQGCGEEGLKVQEIITDLCEFWWNHRFVDRECMVIQLLPLLLAKSLDESARKDDIKRLFQLRGGLSVLDWKDDSSHDMRELLLRTVSSPLYLKTNEGKKLICSLFSLDESLVTDLHKAIRVQIPGTKKAILQVYGEVYFGAWRESENFPVVRKAIEDIVIQDLMYAIIHVANPVMVKNLQTILEKFHENKKDPEIESLLHRMYGPILWRSLTAANPRVRVNASIVLAETFPLQDGISQAAKAVQKGTRAMKNLLVDTDPRVRVAAAESTAQILSTYWNVVPTNEIRTLLNHIVAEHASDKSSSAVRAGSLTAITILLRAEDSHAVLRPLLPILGNLVHDKVERVRIAAVRMLLTIKAIPGIKYYHVVPVDHLLARLIDEGIPPRNPTNPVAVGLTQLMMNSYFPQGEGVTGADQVKRSLSFLSSDPNAAMIFYANLASQVSVGSVSKLVALLLRCLVAAVETDKELSNQCQSFGKKRGRHSEAQDENNRKIDGRLSASDTALMASVADAICCLWESIEVSLEEPAHESCRDFLVEAFSGAVLGNVNSHFDKKAAAFNVSNRSDSIALNNCHRTCASILRCAGRLSPKSVEGLASQITLKLAAIGEDKSKGNENIAPHIALLCMWGLTEDVSKSLASSIVKAFDDDDELATPTFEEFSNVSNKRKAGPGGRFPERVVPPLPPRVAMSVLEEILRGSDPSSIAARCAILASDAACNAFERALERGTTSAQRLLKFEPMFTQHMNHENVELILRACEAYGRFALHKEATQNRKLEFSQQAKTLLDWTTIRVAPVLLEGAPGFATPLKDLDISRISRASVSPMAPLSPSLMPPPRQRVDRKETPDKFKLRSETSMHIKIGESFAAVTGDLARGVGKSLMQSSCIIFSEWLAVGGSGAGDISAAATKWCDIFTVESNRDELQTELLPSFLRLAVQLCKSNGDFFVLRKLLESCDEAMENNEVSVMKMSILSLLCGRDANGVSLVRHTVTTILDVADALHQKYEPFSHALEKVPVDITDVWVIKHGYIATCLSSVMSNKQGATFLANELVDRLMKSCSETKLTSRFVFETRCLWFICGNSIFKKALSDVRKLLGNIDAENFAKDGDVKAVVENMLESVAY